jgi:hypothetical protein
VAGTGKGLLREPPQETVRSAGPGDELLEIRLVVLGRRRGLGFGSRLRGPPGLLVAVFRIDPALPLARGFWRDAVLPRRIVSGDGQEPAYRRGDRPTPLRLRHVRGGVEAIPPFADLGPEMVRVDLSRHLIPE